jgi:hypothetical protein
MEDNMKIESKRSGLTVVVPDDEYGVLLATHGEHGAYEYVLNQAGRVLKHRRELEEIRNQVLTDDQRNQVESAARALAIQNIIDIYLCENGYSAYVDKRNRGGMLPESFSRTVERARESCADEIERSTPTDDDRNYAMTMLGFYTEDDRRWSERVSSWCNWEISAPEGWGTAAA